MNHSWSLDIEDMIQTDETGIRVKPNVPEDILAEAQCEKQISICGVWVNSAKMKGPKANPLVWSSKDCADICGGRGSSHKPAS